MFNFDEVNGTYSLDTESTFFEYKLEALKAIQLGLSACYLYINKSNLNEKPSDLSVMMDKLKHLSKLAVELPKVIATQSHNHVVSKPKIALLKHLDLLDETYEHNLAVTEQRLPKCKLQRILELHNNTIQDFKMPANTTLHEEKFAPVAMQNLPIIIDCLYMYTLSVQDKVEPLVGRGLIAYHQLDFDITEHELMLDIYRQKFDLMAQNLQQAVSTIEAVIRLINYINGNNLTEQDTSKMLSDVSFCVMQVEMSNTAMFASLLLI